MRLYIKKSPRDENFDFWLLSLDAHIITASLLVHIFNATFTSGKIPSTREIFRLLLSRKGGDTGDLLQWLTCL